MQTVQRFHLQAVLLLLLLWALLRWQQLQQQVQERGQASVGTVLLRRQFL